MRFMRLTEVIKDTGLGRSSIYKRIAQGEFPKPVPLGGRAVGWVSDEVEAWILERIEERDGREVAH
ncbi:MULTISPECIES: AlpA family transcriptional regulator [unclassified Alcanivorax]|uniref:helix-turn-helix transcriptional regulator n=1 Tax=unclassified Alcanivorax TaxID=2638842 RepID=UPI000789EB28|nr:MULTISPECIES: AlpA family transcriptional regulator [unclassified Alcanivorax]MEE3387827.1 AlpA family transcriptional regulator [Pseudomonadota bacterium]